MQRAATIVMAEGRRMMRLAGALGEREFDALLGSYQLLLSALFEELGGRDVEASGDTVVATFRDEEAAALAAVRAHEAVAARAWPGWPEPGASIGLGRDKAACSDLCDAAELGETFVAEEVAARLPSPRVRDVGRPQTRRSGQAVRAYELVD